MRWEVVRNHLNILGAIGSALTTAVLVTACWQGVGAFDGVDGEGSGEGDDGGTGEGEPACEDPSVGATRLRRLTKDQYNNTVRDLLGLEGNPADAFVPDERVGPFSANSVAPVSDLVVEQYMSVAEELATRAVSDLASLLPCDPGLAGEDACAHEFIAQFGARAYRRPLTDAETTRLQAVYAFGRDSSGYSTGIRLALHAMLQSPYFLYHIELGLPDPNGSVVALTPYELASRLSYLLWNTMPDESLFAAADAGALGSRADVRAQAERMLADPRAEDAIASFHLQWMAVDQLETKDKDPSAFPQFDTAMAAALQAETAAFADHVIRFDDGRLETLLTASYSLIDGPLFELYGLTEPVGHDPTVPVELDPDERAGILTHASVLAAAAHADQSSPILRGVLVRQNVLCQPLPPPPPDVDNVPPDPDPDATTRERFEQHTKDPTCAGCHRLIDPIGFGFENYDAIGAYHSTENGKPIDATGELYGADIEGEFDGAVELAGVLAGSQDVRECVAQQWFRFAFGRMETEDDECSMGLMHDAFAAADYDIRELLFELVMTDAFRFRRAGEGEAERREVPR